MPKRKACVANLHISHIHLPLLCMMDRKYPRYDTVSAVVVSTVYRIRKRQKSSCQHLPFANAWYSECGIRNDRALCVCFFFILEDIADENHCKYIDIARIEIEKKNIYKNKRSNERAEQSMISITSLSFWVVIVNLEHIVFGTIASTNWNANVMWQILS